VRRKQRYDSSGGHLPIAWTKQMGSMPRSSGTRPDISGQMAAGGSGHCITLLDVTATPRRIGGHASHAAWGARRSSIGHGAGEDLDSEEVLDEEDGVFSAGNSGAISLRNTLSWRAAVPSTSL